MPWEVPRLGGLWPGIKRSQYSVGVGGGRLKLRLGEEAYG